MDFLSLFQTFFTGLGGLGFFVGVLILYKTGLLKALWDWKKNGNGTKEFKELSERVTSIEENHFHEVVRKLDNLALLQAEMLYLLRDIKNKLEK